jgi:hypothetical protein
MIVKSQNLSIEDSDFLAAESELAMAIGQIVIHFNNLERDLGELLAALLEANNNFTRSAIVASMSFSQKTDLLAALYLEKFSDDLEKCAACRASIRKLLTIEEERNKYVHSCFSTKTFGSSEYLRIKPKTKGAKGLVVASVAVDISAAKTLKDQISSFRFLELVELYRGCIKHRS